MESVAWIAERKDVLSGLLFMLTLVAYVGYTRHHFSLIRYSAVIVLFALGLMAKPMLVTLPLVLLLLDYWPLGRLNFVGESWRDRQYAACSFVRDRRQRTAFCFRSDFDWQKRAQGQKATGRLRYLLVEKLPLFFLAVICCVLTICASRQSRRSY